VTPLLLGAVGSLALVLAGSILRTFGARYRIARILGTTPRVTIAEAIEIARAGRRVYLRVDGRIDADDDFEGPNQEPLVLRRVRLEVRTGRTWKPFEDHRQTVPFNLNEGLDTIGVDVDALADGLVVVPRESVGTAADMADRVPEGTPPDAQVRARIEQLSSVEHAIVLGVPVVRGAGVVLTADRRRPLVLTILAPDEAMRVLAADGRGRTRVAAALLAVAMTCIGGAVLWAVAVAVLPAILAGVPGFDGLIETVAAASPEPSVAVGGDPRSNGQGPGLVGTPGLAILGVAAIGVLAVAVTTVYVRLTTPPRGPARQDRPDDQHSRTTRERRR
jgi:hypothetical protein